MKKPKKTIVGYNFIKQNIQQINGKKKMKKIVIIC